MIERDFVKQKKREFHVQKFITTTLKNVGHSFTEIQRTPLGEKIIIHTSRPGLIVGRKGQNIRALTESLQSRFDLENPQVEISEVEHPDLDASIVAERIASALERFGSNRFKGIMHKTLENVLSAGALGVEIRLAGKLPSSRAKAWRIYGGHLRKCGEAAIVYVRKATVIAKLKSGVIGIQVDILPPDITMPDTIRLIEPETEAKATKDTTDVTAKDETPEKSKPTAKDETPEKSKPTAKETTETKKDNEANQAEKEESVAETKPKKSNSKNESRQGT